MNGDVLSTGKYLMSEKHGKWVFYDIRGVKYYEQSYNKGIPNGKFVEYYKSGEVKSSGSYKNGFKSGEWEYFDMNGQLVSKITFNDKGVQIKEFRDTRN